MTNSLVISLGLFYLFMAVIASWTLRTSIAPLFVKIVVPSVIVALACVTYFTLPEAFGYPVETTFSALPSQAELVGFAPHDDEKKVDLWLRPAGKPQPRAYSVELTDELKDTLKKARQAQAAGEATMLAKEAKRSNRPGHVYTDIDGGDAPYVLLPNAFNLPRKEASK